MKIPSWIFVLALLIAGCTSQTPTPTPTVLPTPAPTLSQPGVSVTSVPDPEGVVQSFLEAWKADDYTAMYALLDSESQKGILPEDFAARYLETAANLAVEPGAITYELLSQEKHPRSAQVNIRVDLESAIFGKVSREHQMDLVLAEGQWKIKWSDALILPELAGGNSLQLLNDIPPRGLIYDRNGKPMVGFVEAYALGIVPAKINPDAEDNMLNLLSRATGFPPEYILSLYVDFGYDSELYVPITDVSASRLRPYLNALNSYDAIQLTPFTGRYYFDLGIAPQLVGYLSAIQPEEVELYRRKGYQWTERVPRAGVELWAEPYLGGTRGGTLYLNDADGNPLRVLDAVEASPSYSVTLTLDRDFQVQVQKALFGLKGAIVVIERDSGKILALASSPTFDANLFAPNNYNSLFDSPFFEPGDPLFNRATLGQYPLGSVFKIVTMAAALESGVFKPDDIYDCQHTFTDLGDPILYDWTYWDELPPSGELTLSEGLMRSCNIWFYHIGLELFKKGLGSAIPEMAQGFGLGSRTNLIGVNENEEKSGQISIPTTPLEATNLAIGQGVLLVTPLQVARFVAAVGNGGTLYRPTVIEQISSPAGEVIFAPEPEVEGTLPVSPANLAAIQEAMQAVVSNRRGTAYRIFGAFNVNLAGKTGTAETGEGQDPHAWFVAYTFEGREDLPDIAVVAIIENIGEGADFAAPVVRRVLEVYFSGRPLRKYPWEARIGVPKSLIPEEPAPDNNGGG